MDPDLFTLSKKEIKSTNLFWLGFIIYSFGYVLTAVPSINAKFCQAIQIPALLIMIVGAAKLIRAKMESQYLQVFFFIYFLWLLLIIARDFSALSSYTYIKFFLFDPNFGGIIYFAPLLVLFPKNFYFYKRLFVAISVCAIIYLLVDGVFIKYLLSADRSSTTSVGVVEIFSELSFPSGFLLLTLAYQNKNKQLLTIAVVAISLFFAVFRARRGMIFMFLNTVIFSYILYVINSKYKLVILYLTVFIALCVMLYASSIYKVKDNHLFGFLASRGKEDTRSDVELYFYADMKTKDWAIGKGMNGKYFCPGIDEEAVTDYRYVIETGFLQTILKGGFISLGLYLLIAIPAVFQGLFFSRNNFSRAAGIWVLLSILDSYPAVVNSFTLQYLIVWVSIGICYSKKIRLLTEYQVKEIFLSKENNNHTLLS